MAVSKLKEQEDRVISCKLCSRLVAHRERASTERPRRYARETYWAKPLPAFGDPRARLLIVGLAPAAHGGNRTGRMFTGDRSGEWLYEALYRFEFSNRKTSIAPGDGLALEDAFITATARCAPPGNKPTREELLNCRPYLEAELELLERVRVVIALGKIAFDGFLAAWRAAGRPVPRPRPKFEHGGATSLKGGVVLLASYHPSQQNTFTGRLTRVMFHRVFRAARNLLEATSPSRAQG